MGWDFHPDGPEDLQRDPKWGIPENGFVRAFTSSASHYLGFVSGLTNTPLDLVEKAGGEGIPTVAPSSIRASCD
jgi:hypothetical protein